MASLGCTRDTGLTYYNLGPTKPRTNIGLGVFSSEADDDEPFVPNTFQDLFISHVVNAATILEQPVVPTSNVSAHKNFAVDGGSESIADARFSSIDAEESDNDFEPVPSPFAKGVIDDNSIPLPRWPAPLAMDPVTPPIAWEEFRLPPVPERRNTMNNYDSGSFPLGCSKVAVAESNVLNLNASEPPSLNGPSHITSSTN